MDVKRNFNNTYVEFKLDSYETKIITLSKEFNTMSIFNLTNMVGWGIDFITGAVMKYDRKAYDINFDNKKTAIFYPTRINIDTKKNCVELYVIAN